MDKSTTVKSVTHNPTAEKRIHPIRIVIADDHPIFRDGPAAAAGVEGEMKVVARPATDSRL